jgi:hypothetical protein
MCCLCVCVCVCVCVCLHARACVVCVCALPARPTFTSLCPVSCPLASPSNVSQAKKLLMDKVLNVRSVHDILDGLRSDLVRTIKHGMLLVLRMANSAVDFRRQFAAPDQFPAAVFDPSAIRDEGTMMQLVRPEDTTQGY